MIFALPLESVDNTFRYAVNGNGIDANNQLFFFIDIFYLIVAADIEAIHNGSLTFQVIIDFLKSNFR